VPFISPVLDPITYLPDRKFVEQTSILRSTFVAMPNSENAARRKARELVEEIENEHGHVGEETLRQIDDPTIRAKLTNALKAKDGMIGSTVITYQTSRSLATIP